MAWTNSQLIEFFDAYLQTALWASTDNRRALAAEYGVDDFAESARETLLADATAFARDNAADLANLNPARCGHDFWLNRCRHGAGFWDRGLGEVGDRLSAASRVFGDPSLYIGDDGMIYVG
jgi:hypothetical protein